MIAGPPHSAGGIGCLNNRYHDPALGSFLSVDPLVQQTMEPYIYGAANPATYSDPDGLDPDTSSWIRHRAEAGNPDANGVPTQPRGCTYSSGRQCYVDRYGALGSGIYLQASKGYSGGSSSGAVQPVVGPPSAAVLDAVAAFTGAGQLDLTPGVPPRPLDPVGAAIWDYMYGPRVGSSGLLQAVADALGNVSTASGGVALGCAAGRLGPATVPASQCAGAFGGVAAGAGVGRSLALGLDGDPAAACAGLSSYIDVMVPAADDVPYAADLVHRVTTFVVGQSC